MGLGGFACAGNSRAHGNTLWAARLEYLVRLGAGCCEDGALKGRRYREQRKMAPTLAQPSGVSPPTEKYVQSGWWKARALTLASGSIIMPSVSWTLISSGRSSFHRPTWSSRSGQAG